MNVLVAVSSKHGGTREIARVIAEELRALGLDPDLREAGAVRDLAGYDAVVLGSAVYMGNWLPEARAFVARHGAALAGLPVWLFSSGPLGAENPQPPGDPAGGAAVLAATGARGHRVFAGRLERGDLGLGERAISRLVHAPEGDFRDWAAIRAWAREIGAALAAAPVTGDATAARAGAA